MKIKISIDTKSKEDIVALRKLADLLESTSKPEAKTTIATLADEDRPGGGPRG